MQLLTAREAAEYLRVSLFTLGRIEKEGLLVPFRTPGGHRRYSVEMLDEYLERSRAQLGRNAKTILLVDDGEEMLGILSRAFPTCRLTTATDALEVGMKLVEFEPDVVLLNTSMSALDARALALRLHQQGNQPKTLTFEAPREGVGAIEFTDSAPPDVGELREAIEAALEGEPSA